MTTVPASGMTSLPHAMGGPAEGDIEAFQAIHAMDDHAQENGRTLIPHFFAARRQLNSPSPVIPLKLSEIDPPETVKSDALDGEAVVLLANRAVPPPSRDPAFHVDHPVPRDVVPRTERRQRITHLARTRRTFNPGQCSDLFIGGDAPAGNARHHIPDALVTPLSFVHARAATIDGG